ncbi:MAG: RDD family protein [Micromonosporaceae bacterium]
MYGQPQFGYGAGFTPQMMPDRSPQTVPLIQRLCGWGVDAGVLVLVALALAIFTYERIATLVAGTTALHGEDVWQLITSGGDLGGAASTAGALVWAAAVNAVTRAFVALVLIQFVYQFVALAWTGRTPGKLVVDTRVAAPGRTRGIGVGRAAGRAAVTTVADTGLFALACCLLVRGWWLAAVLCWMLAVVGFWAQVVPILGRDRRTLADRIAGTTVVPGGVYQAVADHGLQLASERSRALLASERGQALLRKLRQRDS